MLDTGDKANRIPLLHHTGVQISRNRGSCPSPSGRRWPEGPDEGAFPALTRRFAPPSPKGRGTCPKQKPASILLLERTASRNLDKSVVLSIAAPSPRNWSLFCTLILRLCTF